MIRQFLKALNILNKGNKLSFYLILFFLLISVALEFISFSLLIPMISFVFTDVNQIEKNIFLNYFNFFKKDNLNIILLIFLIIIIFKLIILLIFEKIIHKSLYKMQIDLNKNIFSNFIKSDWQDMTKKSISEIHRIVSGSDVMNYVTQGIYNYIVISKNIFILFILFLFLLNLNYMATFTIITLFLTFTLIFTKLTSYAALNASIKAKEYRDNKLRNIYETIEGLREIKIFGFQKFIINKYFKNEVKLAEIQILRRVIEKLPKVFLELTFIVLLTYSIYHFYEAQLLSIYIPTISIFILVFARMVPLIVVINTLIQRVKFNDFSINETINLIQKAQRLIHIKQKQNLENDTEYNQKSIIVSENSKIEFRNLSFRYSNKLIFDNLNLKFNTNTLIGLTGDNGTGKSTFFDLLSSLLKPHKGEILFNGKNIKDLGNIWTKGIGYLSQSFFIFDDTLKNNITLFEENTKINDTLLKKAIDISGVNNFIEDLPDGIHTNLGSTVKTLSGGQKQKIAIARIIYKNSDILIFDEPTSSLDRNSIDEFFEILKKMKDKNKFIFMISHSNELMNKFDEIYQIKNKKIIKI